MSRLLRLTQRLAKMEKGQAEGREPSDSPLFDSVQLQAQKLIGVNARLDKLEQETEQLHRKFVWRQRVCLPCLDYLDDGLSTE